MCVRSFSSHAHLMKTIPILIAIGTPLYPVHMHSSKCKTSDFTTACLECGFTICSELTTTILIARADNEKIKSNLFCLSHT